MSAPEPAQGQAASHVVVPSPNKPRPDDRWALAIADSLRRTEISYHREGSGPGSRFEGELLEDVLARVAISMMLARQAEAEAAAQERPAPEARHWDGAVNQATRLIDWILASGGTARYHDGPSAIAIDAPGTRTLTAVPGDWIIRQLDGTFRVLSEDAKPAPALPVAVRALRTIAWGATPDLKPVDPSAVADKALVELRDLGVSLTGGDLPVPPVPGDASRASLRFALLGKIQELTGCEDGGDCYRCNQHTAEVLAGLPSLGTAWRLLGETRRQLATASAEISELSRAVVASADRDDLAVRCDKLKALLDEATKIACWYGDLNSKQRARTGAIRAEGGLPAVDHFSHLEDQ